MSIPPAQALSELKALANPDKAAQMAAYHKVDRLYLGVSNPEIDGLCKTWRVGASIQDRLDIASYLWATNILEARIAATRLLSQARIKPDDGDVWDLIVSWVPDFDSWAIADHASSAAARRLLADPSRLDQVEIWSHSPDMWTRRAALVMTLPWAKLRNPKPSEIAARERILGWAASYVPDQQWFIQKAIAWWLRTLSRHDPDRVRQFLANHAENMKPFARREAAKYL